MEADTFRIVAMAVGIPLLVIGIAFLFATLLIIGNTIDTSNQHGPDWFILLPLLDLVLLEFLDTILPPFTTALAIFSLPRAIRDAIKTAEIKPLALRTLLLGIGFSLFGGAALFLASLP